MTTLIKNAKILTMDDDDRIYEKADIFVKDGVIEALDPDPGQISGDDVRIIEASGLLAMPGLINGHYHSPSAFMKGALEGLPLEIIMLFENPLEAEYSSHRMYYLRTMLCALEMLKYGVTSVRDDAHFFAPPTGEAIDGIFQAYADSGMRASVGFGIPNTVEYDKLPFLKDLLPEEFRHQMEKEELLSDEFILDLNRRAIDRWHGSCQDRLSIFGSCSAPQRVTETLLQGINEMCATHDLAFDMHILETRTQRVLGVEKYGKSIIQYVNDLGVLNDRSTIIHAVWTDENDMGLIADAGSVVAHNPISNLKLGSGVMPFKRMRNHEIPICIGSDEACADDSANLWHVAKTGALIQKIAQWDDRNWPKASEYLWAICRGGARAMRREKRTGMLVAGCDADLILVDLQTLAFTPLNDLKRQLIFCENGSSVVMTMVAGKIVVEQGRVLTVDEEAIKNEIRELWPKYRSACDRANKAASTLEPYYRSVYERASNYDIGLNRWLIDHN